MDKQNVKYLTYGFIIGAWVLFCICKLPELQEQQRMKVYAQEQQILDDMREAQKVVIPITTSIAEDVIIEDEMEIEEEIIPLLDATEDYPKYTDPDLILLAQLIEAEGGIESYQCKLYIGSVVLNRMTHKDFPDGLRDVIFQVNANGVHQFSVTMVREDGTQAIDCEPSKESLDAAAEILTYGTQLPEDVVVFYTENCKGNWVTTRETYTQVDHTIFAYAHKE